jgi:hypothetical protein
MKEKGRKKKNEIKIDVFKQEYIPADVRDCIYRHFEGIKHSLCTGNEFNNNNKMKSSHKIGTRISSNEVQ